MATLALVAAAALLALAARELAPRAVAAIRRWRHGRDRQVTCTGCGNDLPARKAVTVSDTFDAHDGGPGGTAVSTDWHRRCARQAGVA